MEQAPVRFLTLLCRAILILIVPFFLLLTNLRVALSQTFFAIEYRMPGFPSDPYGFSKDDRLRWASVTSEYLLGSSAPGSLSTLRIPLQQSPKERQIDDREQLYTAREIRHLDDTRHVIVSSMVAWMISGALVLILTVALWRGADQLVVESTWLFACIATCLLMIGGTALLALDFDATFDHIHDAFFAHNTYLFFLTDSLIRIFPPRFWQDFFLFVPGATFCEALALSIGLGVRRFKRNRANRPHAAHAADHPHDDG